MVNLMWSIFVNLRTILGEGSQTIWIDGKITNWKFSLDNECYKTFARTILFQEELKEMWKEYEDLLSQQLMLTNTHVPQFIHQLTEIAIKKSCVEAFRNGNTDKQEKRQQTQKQDQHSYKYNTTDKMLRVEAVKTYQSVADCTKSFEELCSEYCRQNKICSKCATSKCLQLSNSKISQDSENRRQQLCEKRIKTLIFKKTKNKNAQKVDFTAIREMNKNINILNQINQRILLPQKQHKH